MEVGSFMVCLCMFLSFKWLLGGMEVGVFVGIFLSFGRFFNPTNLGQVNLLMFLFPKNQSPNHFCFTRNEGITYLDPICL